MAIHYTIHYRGAPDTLRAAIDALADPDLIWPISVGPTRPLDREILREEGFADDFTASAVLRLNKWRLAEATQWLRALRDRLGRDKVLVLFQNESELPD